MKQFFAKHKRFIQRVFAFLIALCIMGACVLLSYVVPPIKAHAESVADQWEDYIDNMYGEGSSYLLESALEMTGGAAMIGVMYGLNIIQTYPSSAVPINTLSTRQGWCYNNADQKKYLVNTTVSSGSYHASDGGITVCKSGFFTINLSWIGSQSHSISNYIGSKYCGSIYYPGPSQSFDCDITSNFANGLNTLTFTDTSSPKDVAWLIATGNTSIPTIDLQNDDISDYVRYNVSGSRPSKIATMFSGGDVNWSDYMESIGIDPTTTIDPSNIFDFIVNVYNPAIEENYPDLTVYLFYPEEPTTETESASGCNCHVEVYVEPTINVYVENQFPSEWVEDYTVATDPVETFVEPTMPTVEETQEETLPSFELDDEVIDGLGFWRELWNSAMHATDFIGVITALLLLSIAEWALWHVGR